MELATVAADLADELVDEEIRRRLRAQRLRGDFVAIHVTPATPAQVPDEAAARLVVLGPEHAHQEGAGGSADSALEHAAALLDATGGGPRFYRNMLVFLAPDAACLAELRQAVRQLLAWQAVAAGRARVGTVDLTDAQAQVRQQEEIVGLRLNAAWQWLLAPSATGWRLSRAGGGEELAMRASRQLRADASLFVEYPAARLRADLDRIPLWPAGRNHVGLAEVWESYARSLELPRLRSSAVLAAAVLSGLASPDWTSETFAYARSWDAEHSRFEGLVAGRAGAMSLQGSGLLVRSAAAKAQLEAQQAGT